MSANVKALEEYIELEAVKIIDHMYSNDKRMWTSGVEYKWLKEKIRASIIQQLNSS